MANETRVGENRERSMPLCETNPNCMSIQTGFNHLNGNYIPLETCERGFGFVFPELRFFGESAVRRQRGWLPDDTGGSTPTERRGYTTK